MGCCASTKKPPPSPEFHQHSSKSPPVDEETVKEVLSETPNPTHFTKNEDQPIIITPKKNIPKIHNQHFQNHYKNKYAGDVSGEVSGEVSEICSNLSESISTTTFEEEVDVYRRRSPAKVRNRREQFPGEIPAVLRNSPARGKQQSPGRVRSGSEMGVRGPGFGSTGRQRPVPGNGHVSRSRSPANRTVVRGGGGGGVKSGVGKSPSKRKTENSPSRVGARVQEVARKPDLPEYGSGLERHESPWAPTDRNEDDESLDNPLVSLECFIFL
uniref:Uncharacterized protein n=1 Tax=Tanacetum cinerariifolium TaxID=118510 RepID=A0A6L2NBS7_TANCI|nr:hypothetical protein [Tanacetum cinerariifolium]